MQHIFFHQKAANPVNYYQTSVKKKHTLIPCHSRSIQRHIITEPWAQTAICRLAAHHLREKWWNTFQHADTFKRSSDLPCLSWYNFKIFCVASVVEWLINVDLPVFHSVLSHVGSLPELSIGSLQEQTVAQNELHLLTQCYHKRCLKLPGGSYLCSCDFCQHIC